MTERLSNWEQRVNDYLAEARFRPLEPGKHDSALFVASAVEAITGVDFAADFRGKYDTCEGGHEAIKKAGHANLPTLLDELFPLMKRAEARRGDIILLTDKNLALCWGAVALALNESPEEGLARIEPDRWQRAWKVG